jgi:hypothetical protein
VQSWRDIVHLRLDQSLLFVFIVNLAFVAVGVGEHITRTGISQSNALITLIVGYSGLRVDSLAELVLTIGQVFTTWNCRSRLTRENGAHWVTAHEIPVRATSTVAPKVLVTKLKTRTVSLSTPHIDQLTMC